MYMSECGVACTSMNHGSICLLVEEFNRLVTLQMILRDDGKRPEFMQDLKRHTSMRPRSCDVSVSVMSMSMYWPIFVGGFL